MTRPARGPGPRLQRGAAPRSPAHRASRLPRGPRGRGALRELRRGRHGRGASENRAPGPCPPFRSAPRECGAVTPLSPPCRPPIGSPLFSADRSPGKGEGVLRSPLKGPSRLLVSRQVASTSGVGRAHGPPPPSSPRPAPEPQRSRRARGPRRTLSGAFFRHPGLPGRRVKQGRGGQGRPLQQEPSEGRTRDQASSPTGARLRVWDAVGSAEARPGAPAAEPAGWPGPPG